MFTECCFPNDIFYRADFDFLSCISIFDFFQARSSSRIEVRGKVSAAANHRGAPRVLFQRFEFCGASVWRAKFYRAHRRDSASYLEKKFYDFNFGRHNPVYDFEPSDVAQK